MRSASGMKGSSGSVRYFLSWFSLLLLLLHTHIQAEVSDKQPPGRIIYDQRQSGKFNIQVSIKDVAIIEMDQNAFDDQSSDGDDYYYDEEDLTVKPLPSWITKPSGVTTPKPLVQGILNSSVINEISNENNTSPASSQIQLISISNAIFSNNSNTNFSTNLPVTPATASLNISKSESLSTISKLYSHKPDSKIMKNVIISTTNLVPTDSLSSAHLPPFSSRSNDIPTEAPTEAMSHEKQRPQNRSQNHRFFQRSQNNEVQVFPRHSEDDGTKIYKIKVTHAHKQNTAMHRYSSHNHNAFRRRCRSGQFLDETGACRMKRSPSILKKLFQMLVSLPLGSSEATEDAANS